MRNFLNARYGGASTEEMVNAVLERYLEEPENDVLVLKDDDDVMSGLVMVSGVQKELYKRWGETLLLDWTHNTNNLGFLLGTMYIQ